MIFRHRLLALSISFAGRPLLHAKKLYSFAECSGLSISDRGRSNKFICCVSGFSLPDDTGAVVDQIGLYPVGKSQGNLADVGFCHSNDPPL